VTDDGSGRNSALAITQSAGKTGTTQDSRDAWFAGFTCNIANVVWMGYPAGQQKMTNVDGEKTVTGSNVPARIWHDLMSQVADDDPGCEFAVANGGPKVETGPDQPRIPVTDKDGNLVLDDEGVPEYAAGGSSSTGTTGGSSSGSGTSPTGAGPSLSTSGGSSSTGGGSPAGSTTDGSAPANPEPPAPEATAAPTPTSDAPPATTDGSTTGGTGDTGGTADGSDAG